MFSTCDCPLSTAIQTIATSECQEHFGQIQRVILQRRGNDFDGTAGNDITVLADWQTRIAAADDTKAQPTPLFVNGIITPGDKITNGGGDNSTLNGEIELTGINQSIFSGEFKGLTAAQIDSLSAYFCENKLQAYFVTGGGKIIAKATAGVAPFSGFDASSFAILDKSNQGFGTKDINTFDFNIEQGWSCVYSIITPSFDPLSDI